MLECKKRSRLWYLLPIFFGILGGLIGYFAVKYDDHKKAKRLLYVGIAISSVGIILSISTGSLLEQVVEEFVSISF